MSGLDKLVPGPDSGSAQTGRGWKKRAGYAAAACVAVSLAGLLLVTLLARLLEDGNGLVKVQALVSQIHAWGTAIQCAAVALVILRWQGLVAWAAAKGIVQPFERERAEAFRGKAAAFLLLYLLLIPIGPHRVWSLFAG